MSKVLVGMFVGACLTFLVSGIVMRVERNLMRQDATKAGAAEWVIDPVTGKRKFEWKGGQP